MISKKLMKKHNVQQLSYSLSQERYINQTCVAHVRAYIGECEEGKQLVVITDQHRHEVDVQLLNSRKAAITYIRDRGFWTRLSKISTARVRASI